MLSCFRLVINLPFSLLHGGIKAQLTFLVSLQASKKRQKRNKREIPCRNFAETGKCKFGAKGECVFICGAPRTGAEDVDEKPKDEKIPVSTKPFMSASGYS